MQRNHSRRVQKAPELNVAWHLRKKHLEGSRTHMTEVDPEGGQPQPDRPGGGPGRPLVPSGPSFRKVLSPPMRINLNHSLGLFDQIPIVTKDFPVGHPSLQAKHA
jgi:hypothetical protein